MIVLDTHVWFYPIMEIVMAYYLCEFHRIFDFSEGLLVEVATFSLIMLTVAVPILFTLINTVSQRYKSEMIVNLCWNEPILKLFAWIAAINILFIFMYHLLTENTKILIQPYFTVFTYLAFALSGYLFYRFIKKAFLYAKSSRYAADKLLAKIKKEVSNGVQE